MYLRFAMLKISKTTPLILLSHLVSYETYQVISLSIIVGYSLDTMFLKSYIRILKQNFDLSQFCSTYLVLGAAQSQVSLSVQSAYLRTRKGGVTRRLKV